MHWLPAIFVALLTGAFGVLATGFVAALHQEWHRVSKREGGAAFVLVFCALLGGMVAFVIGMVQAFSAGAEFGPALLRGCGIVLGIAGGVALLSRLLADVPPKLGGRRLTFEMEIKLPAGRALPEGEAHFCLSTSAMRKLCADYGQLNLSDARLEQERWIIPAEASLFTSCGRLTATATAGSEELGAFAIPLRAHPRRADEQWSAWSAATGTEFRFRVSRIEPPPPPPSAEEFAAAQEAEAQAKFESIPADAPLLAWLDCTEPHISAPRRSDAVQHILRRSAFVAELNALMLTDGPYDEAARAAAAALHFIGRMDQPGADLIPGVTAAGRDIIARIRRFNDSTPAQDPGYLGAADVSIRFIAWMNAVRALREKAGGDFTSELGEILQLSRRRGDSHVMSADIRRVASFYLHQWAGIAPLSGDPPPK